jgi:hypothetical protein
MPSAGDQVFSIWAWGTFEIKTIRHLYDESKIITFIDAENGMVDAWDYWQSHRIQSFSYIR